MKRQVLLLPALALILGLPSAAFAQNTGIGTINPGTTLDVAGAITSRETTGAISANAITIPTNVSLFRITGTATATVAVTAAAAPNAGQRLILYNNTTGGFGATLNGLTVANGQSAEFIYSNGGWRTVDNGVGSIGSPATWNTTGNTGLTDGTNNFIGTNDAVALNFRVGGGKAGRIGTTDGNTALGYQTQFYTSSGSYNTSLGYQTLLGNLSGQYNTAIGYQSLSSTTASNNTGAGYQTLYNNTTGGTNTAVGSNALYTNLSGSGNTAVGFYALRLNSTGVYNVAVGDYALFSNTSYNNTGIGSNALASNTTGNDNTASGVSALGANTGGIKNTAGGSASLGQNTNGTGNTALGYGALNFNTTGSYNTAMGYSAGSASSALTNTTAIGSYARVTASNAMVLGSINGVNGATASTSVGIGTTAPTAALDVVGSGSSNFAARFKNSSVGGAILAESNSGTYIVQLNTGGALAGYIYNYGSSVGYVTSSDVRLKEGITSTHYGLTDLLKIDVKDYTYKSDKTHLPQTGFLAQQLYTIFPMAVAKGGDDIATAPWGVDYGKLTPLLVKSVQELSAKVSALEAEQAALKTTVEQMRAELAGKK